MADFQVIKCDFGNLEFSNSDWELPKKATKAGLVKDNSVSITLSAGLRSPF